MYKTNFFSSINNTVSQYLKEIKLDILYGFSIYDLLKLYIIGIIQGTISNRASSISFSFFMALFPFLLFVLNLIPFFPIENFSNYNELYGSIGALIIMMIYIWINSISLILGFELNAVIYKLKNN